MKKLKYAMALRGLFNKQLTVVFNKKVFAGKFLKFTLALRLPNLSMKIGMLLMMYAKHPVNP